MAAMSKADYSTCNLWNFKAMSPLHQTVESITLSRFSRYRVPTYRLNVSQESTSEIICAECRGLFYAIRPLTNIWSYFLTNLIKENKDCQLFYDKSLITAFNNRRRLSFRTSRNPPYRFSSFRYHQCYICCEIYLRVHRLFVSTLSFKLSWKFSLISDVQPLAIIGIDIQCALLSVS